MQATLNDEANSDEEQIASAKQNTSVSLFKIFKKKEKSKKRRKQKKKKTTKENKPKTEISFQRYYLCPDRMVSVIREEMDVAPSSNDNSGTSAYPILEGSHSGRLLHKYLRRQSQAEACAVFRHVVSVGALRSSVS